MIAACAAAGAGYVITRGWPGTSAAAESTSSNSATTTVSVPAEQTAVDPDEPNPSSGQTVATDEPVVVETEAVSVVLTYSAWSAADRQVLAGGYASGVIEDGGVCTLTLTQGGHRHGRGPGHARRQHHRVRRPRRARQPATAGTWQATLTYASATHSGTSASAPVEVAA